MPSHSHLQLHRHADAPRSIWAATTTPVPTPTWQSALRKYRPWLMGCVWSVCLALSAFSFWKAAAPTSPSGAGGNDLVAAASPGLGASSRQLVTRPIQEIRPGMRVQAQNPEVDASDLPDLTIEPIEWRLVTHLMHKPDGGTLTIESLVPLEEVQPVGQTEEVSYPELGIDGPATVTNITACPPIEAGTGRLVTSTFKHSSGDVIDLQIASEPRPIGTTRNHPFWSEDRQDWVQAGSLQVGERLRRYTDDAETTYEITTVVSLLPRPGPEAVYNLTVDGTHTYLVGESGVLVHNTGKDVYVNPSDLRTGPSQDALDRATKKTLIPPTPEEVAASRAQWAAKFGPKPNKMNQQIHQGAAPKSIVRVDTPKITGEQLHMHFKGGHALNIDGTWKHGGRIITGAETDWLKSHNWPL